MQALEHLLGKDRARQAMGRHADVINVSSGVVAEALGLLSDSFGKEAAIEMGVKHPQVLVLTRKLLQAKIQYLCSEIEGAKAALLT